MKNEKNERTNEGKEDPVLVYISSVSISIIQLINYYHEYNKSSSIFREAVSTKKLFISKKNSIRYIADMLRNDNAS